MSNLTCCKLGHFDYRVNLNDTLFKEIIYYIFKDIIFIKIKINNKTSSNPNDSK